MTHSISIAPLNSLVLVAEAPTQEGPSAFDGKGVAATPSCIAVVCFPEPDGETKVSLGPCKDMDGAPEFSAVLDTPNRKVAVWTIEWQKLLTASVPTERTKISIWRNHPRWPTEVYIGIGE